jgi:small subunit ribosomal protein S16
MATRIRLRRVGRKKQPEFRIVVAEHTAARDGRFIETLGHYRPREKPAVIQVDADRVRAWIAQGALPTETVRSLLKQAGVFARPGAPAPTEPPGSPAAE